MFVATWDGVTPVAFTSDLGGFFNTFQVIIASNGTWTFVKFTYGDIQWGRLDTVIGVSAGDRLNYITHPASLTSSVLLLDYTNVIYQIDSKLS